MYVALAPPCSHLKVHKKARSKAIVINRHGYNKVKHAQSTLTQIKSPTKWQKKQHQSGKQAIIIKRYGYKVKHAQEEGCDFHS